jgi:hypothetical protein
MDATILPIERGDRYVVRIQQPQWHCWSFADWNEFCHEQKKQRNKQRKQARDEAIQRAIQTGEPCVIHMPALV